MRRLDHPDFTDTKLENLLTRSHGFPTPVFVTAAPNGYGCSYFYNKETNQQPTEKQICCKNICLR
ncbi:protein of unknown function (plasmid) [Pararobbsia alpina]